ncbi:MAG: hypothetical protein U0Q18_36195 [Bryobacteraceae bacterium]
MNLQSLIAKLRWERVQVEVAIAALEALQELRGDDRKSSTPQEHRTRGKSAGT